MRSALIGALLVGLAGCQFRVEVGSNSPAPISTGGGGGVGSFCNDTELASYRVTLAETPIPPSCWLDGGADRVLPEETFEVLYVRGGSASTLGLRGMQPQRLGDAPSIAPVEAIAGSTPDGGAGLNFWVNETLTSRTRVDGPAWEFTTWLWFRFDRLDTPLTSGTLGLSSGVGCIPTANETCEVLDGGTKEPGCSLNRDFTAERITPASAWFEREPPGFAPPATRLLVSLETPENEGTFCWGSEPRLQSRRSTGRRSLEVWFSDGRTARLNERLLKLGDAPAISLGPSLPAGPTVLSSMPTPGALETRTTSVEMTAGSCGALFDFSPFADLPARLELRSTWECTGGGCPFVTSVDRGSCVTRVDYFAIPF